MRRFCVCYQNPALHRLKKNTLGTGRDGGLHTHTKSISRFTKHTHTRLLNLGKKKR